MKNSLIFLLYFIGLTQASGILTTIEQMEYLTKAKQTFNDILNLNGNPKYVLSYNIYSDGDTNYWHETIIDEKLKLIEKTSLNRNKEKEYVYKYEFDSLGNLIYEISESPDGKIRWGKKYLYNFESIEITTKNIDSTKKTYTIEKYDDENRILSIKTVDNSCECLKEEFWSYDESGNILSNILLNQNCKDTIEKHLLKYDDSNNLLEERKYSTSRKGLRLQYTFKFKYDSCNNLIERAFIWKNKKPYGKTVFYYDSLQREISKSYITRKGKKLKKSTTTYSGTKKMTTKFMEKGFIKFTIDSLNRIYLFEEFTKRDKLIYSRFEKVTVDKFGNWTDIQSDYFAKYPFWFKRKWTKYSKRKIEYF